MDLSTLKTDPALVNDGVVVIYEPPDDPDGKPARIVIRGSGYRAYVDFLYNEQGKNIGKKANQQINAKTIRKSLKSAREGIARYIWISHEDLTMDGAPLPNTYEAKMEALEYDDFRRFIEEESEDIKNFQREADAEDAAAVKSVG